MENTSSDKFTSKGWLSIKLEMASKTPVRNFLKMSSKKKDPPPKVMRTRGKWMYEDGDFAENNEEDEKEEEELTRNLYSKNVIETDHQMNSKLLNVQFKNNTTNFAEKNNAYSWGELDHKKVADSTKKIQFDQTLSTLIFQQNAALSNDDSDEQLATFPLENFAYKQTKIANKSKSNVPKLKDSNFLKAIRFLLSETTLLSRPIDQIETSNQDLIESFNNLGSNSDPNKFEENRSRTLRETVILILFHVGFHSATNHVIEVLTDILEYYLIKFFDHLRICDETIVLDNNKDENLDRNVQLDMAITKTLRHMKVPDLETLSRYNFQLTRYLERLMSRPT